MAQPARDNCSVLLDLGFFVDHVLTNDRIKLFDLHLVRHGALVFAGCVVVTSASGRNQFNFFSHCLNLLALGTNISDNLFDTKLVDNTHAFC